MKKHFVLHIYHSTTDIFFFFPEIIPFGPMLNIDLVFWVYHKLGGLNNGNLLSHGAGGGKPKSICQQS
jgi:hypothetical protein